MLHAGVLLLPRTDARTTLARVSGKEGYGYYLVSDVLVVTVRIRKRAIKLHSEALISPTSTPYEK